MTNMKLVDANKAFEEITDLAGQAETKGAYGAYWKAARVVQNMTAVEAEPVVHAEWVDGYSCYTNGVKVYDSIDCSACEDVFKIETHDSDYWKKRLKRCPSCGAIMDVVNSASQL